MKIENFEGVKNQFLLTEDNGDVTLQSYNSIVAKIDNGILKFGEDWDYSTTTSKYVYKFIELFINRISIKQKEKIKIALFKKNKKTYFKRLINIGYIPITNF